MFVRQQPIRKEFDMITLRKLTLVTAAVSIATALLGAMPAAEAGRATSQWAKPRINFGKVAVQPRFRPKALTIGTQGQSAGKNSTFCGNGDQFTYYEQDANGKQVGPTHYGCTD
jgi:hypothetical protein